VAAISVCSAVGFKEIRRSIKAPLAGGAGKERGSKDITSFLTLVTGTS